MLGKLPGEDFEGVSKMKKVVVAGVNWRPGIGNLVWGFVAVAVNARAHVHGLTSVSVERVSGARGA
jgi:hypothetical protein